jgi:uncharacterized protein (DUF1800 family)
MMLQQANREALNAAMGWWFKRMAQGPYPLQEKLTFFWHGHFTTSAKDERQATLMWRQNELLRQSAAGNFEAFVRAISRDPAMLDYLNNNQNRKEHPNENYARELMELFTLGIGNYTEKDIKEAARAFTGWGHDGNDFVFRRMQHDEDSKVFFGRAGTFDGDDIISMILRHPACPKFISGELFKYFAYDDIEPALAQSMGDKLFSDRYELRPLLRAILTSKAFYSPKSIGVQIKGPLQLVIGTIRALGVPMPPTQALASALTQMGQLPLMPPNVRGWPGGAMWINTSTLFIRYNTAIWLTGGDVPALNVVNRKGEAGRPIFPGGVNFQPGDDAKDGANNGGDIAATPEQIVDNWVARLIQRPISDEKKKVLIDALGNRPNSPDAQRKVVQLIVSTPDFQLC